MTPTWRGTDLPASLPTSRRSYTEETRARSFIGLSVSPPHPPSRVGHQFACHPAQRARIEGAVAQAEVDHAAEDGGVAVRGPHDRVDEARRPAEPGRRAGVPQVPAEPAAQRRRVPPGRVGLRGGRSREGAGEHRVEDALAGEGVDEREGVAGEEQRAAARRWAAGGERQVVGAQAGGGGGGQQGGPGGGEGRPAWGPPPPGLTLTPRWAAPPPPGPPRASGAPRPGRG